MKQAMIALLGLGIMGAANAETPLSKKYENADWELAPTSCAMKLQIFEDGSAIYNGAHTNTKALPMWLKNYKFYSRASEDQQCAAIYTPPGTLNCKLNDVIDVLNDQAIPIKYYINNNLPTAVLTEASLRLN